MNFLKDVIEKEKEYSIYTHPFIGWYIVGIIMIIAMIIKVV